MIKKVIFVRFSTVMVANSRPLYTRFVIKLKVNLTDRIIYFMLLFFQNFYIYCDNTVIVNSFGHYNRRENLKDCVLFSNKHLKSI